MYDGAGNHIIPRPDVLIGKLHAIYDFGATLSVAISEVTVPLYGTQTDRLFADFTNWLSSTL